MDLSKLREPFGPSDLEWRVQRSGEKNGKVWAIVVPYITARAIQDRLDEVCGPENWANEFRELPTGFLCGISIRVDGEWVTKWNGADKTDIEATKGGLSGAEKRAAVEWGIGRYLYALDEFFANVHDRGTMRGDYKDDSGKRHYFRWDPPDLPAWAAPNGNGSDPRERIRADIAAALDTINVGALSFKGRENVEKIRALLSDDDATAEALNTAADYLGSLLAKGVESAA